MLPLFADINKRTSLYTFSHPMGLLYATRITQIALFVTKKAAFDMRPKGLVQNASISLVTRKENTLRYDTLNVSAHDKTTG